MAQYLAQQNDKMSSVGKIISEEYAFLILSVGKYSTYLAIFTNAVFYRIHKTYVFIFF